MSLDLGRGDTVFVATPRLGQALARRTAAGWLYAALFIVALVPVLITPIPAMVDYVNHLSRMYLLAAAGTPAASPFYVVKWTLTPDLAMDLVVPRLAHWLGAESATRLFLMASQILVVTGAMAIEAVVKRRQQISGMMALLALYCAPFAWGFLNFEFALGLALWGIALWLALRDRPWASRFCLHALVVALLFVSHLFALGLYGFTLGVHEGRAAWRRRAAPGDLLATVLTLAAPAALLLGLMVGSGGSVGQAGNSWHLIMKPFLIFAILDGYSLVLSTIETLLLLGLAHALWDRGALRFVGSGGWIAAGMLVLYVAVPSQLLGTALVDVRVVAAALLIVPAFVEVAFPNERWRRGVIGGATALVLINVGLTTYVWQSYQEDYRALIGSFARLGAGTHVLVGRSGGEAADPPFQDLTEYPMFHAPTLAAPLAGAFVPTLFTTTGKQPLEVRAADQRLSYSCGGPILTVILKAIAEGHGPADAPDFVRGWTRDFDDLYVVGAPEPNPMPERLELLETHRRFTLYRIRKAGAPPTSPPPAAGSPRRPAE